jgi:exodeoxyribonuclease VII large subunit
VDFRVISVAVQGPSAVVQIVEALNRLDEDPDVDVIILARGGGSVEDLLPFSDETLCRAVFACRTPVISAIGHETDTPLVDFVADLRASTPTDAAKRAVPDLAEELSLLTDARRRLARAITHRLDREQQRLDALRSRPVLAAPSTLVDQHVQAVDGLRSRARLVLSHRLDRASSEAHHTVARLRSLSPLATLERGYAVVRRAVDGAVLRDAATVPVGDDLRVRLASGELAARVVES